MLGINLVHIHSRLSNLSGFLRLHPNVAESRTGPPLPRPPISVLFRGFPTGFYFQPLSLPCTSYRAAGISPQQPVSARQATEVPGLRIPLGTVHYIGIDIPHLVFLSIAPSS